MENVRKRMKMELVCNKRRAEKLIKKPTFKDNTIYNEQLSAFHMNIDIMKFDKPIFVGFSVLDLSKNLMYDFHYHTMKNYYKDDIELLYMDTGA